MAYCIAVLQDGDSLPGDIDDVAVGFEEPFVILGASLGQVARSIAAYVHHAGVHTVADEPVVVPDLDQILFDWAAYAATLLEHLEDTAITVHLYSLGDVGDKPGVCTPIETPGSFTDWAAENTTVLRRMHVPLIQTVKVSSDVL